VDPETTLDDLGDSFETKRKYV